MLKHVRRDDSGKSPTNALQQRHHPRAFTHAASVSNGALLRRTPAGGVTGGSGDKNNRAGHKTGGSASKTSGNKGKKRPAGDTSPVSDRGGKRPRTDRVKSPATAGTAAFGSGLGSQSAIGAGSGSSFGSGAVPYASQAGSNTAQGGSSPRPIRGVIDPIQAPWDGKVVDTDEADFVSNSHEKIIAEEINGCTAIFAWCSDGKLVLGHFSTTYDEAKRRHAWLGDKLKNALGASKIRKIVVWTPKGVGNPPQDHKDIDVLMRAFKPYLHYENKPGVNYTPVIHNYPYREQSGDTWRFRATAGKVGEVEDDYGFFPDPESSK